MSARLLSVLLFLAAPWVCPAGEPEAAPTPKALPRLVDLGASKCIPCRMMKPVLEKLTRDYAGQMEVVFIDVWQKRDEAARYSVRVIPTQIFYDASGRELARHEGYMSEQAILTQWRELHVDLTPPAPAGKGT